MVIVQHLVVIVIGTCFDIGAHHDPVIPIFILVGQVYIAGDAYLQLIAGGASAVKPLVKGLFHHDFQHPRLGVFCILAIGIIGVVRLCIPDWILRRVGGKITRILVRSLQDLHLDIFGIDCLVGLLARSRNTG